MNVQAEYQEGLLVKVTEEVTVYYDQLARKIKLIRDNKVVNDFTIDKDTYTLDEFLQYVSKLISNEDGR